MDIFAHGLWGAAAVKALNRSVGAFKRNPISPWWTGFWATFPDLLAFTPLAVVIVLSLITGDADFIGRGATWFLYPFGHSAVTWVAVFLATWAVFRRPRWELLGWLTHIVIDIGTHPDGYYPTQFLWPLSDFTFGGISWRTALFLGVNYALLALVHYALRDHKSLKDGFHAMTLTRKVFFVLLFIVSFGAFIR